MPRTTLVEYFDDRIRSSEPFVTYDDGLHSATYTYDAVRGAAQSCARRLSSDGVEPGDRVILWAESRPEWIIALWGILLARGVVVPVDYRASADLLVQVADIVEARLLIAGDEVVPPTVPDRSGCRTLALSDLAADQPAGGAAEPADPGPVPDLAEIIFTSGATADPKGVEITHRNLLANIEPVEREVLKYRSYARPFRPIRFLNLLPLSHMFGQAMATFIPPLIEGQTVFVRGVNPAHIVRQIRDRRISVLVCVPKMLEVLREHVRRVIPQVDHTPARRLSIAGRWWRYRSVHRTFGFKFWAFVVGGAPLDPDLEAFWSRLGFLVIQGYGLTETAPIVTLNHPFRARRGTVGTPIGGVELKIAADGEILVRGENVTRGYYNAPAATAAAFADGWFHTGDIGSLDEAGRLLVQGRKKEMIVTPEGLNVFPADVERVLCAVSGVRDAAVVGNRVEGNEQVHAALVLDPGVEASAVIRQANRQLEAHQLIRSYDIWPEPALPRTEGTRKLKRGAVRRWVQSREQAPPDQSSVSGQGLLQVVARFAGGREVTTATTLEELGLSSIARIELMLALEQAHDCAIDEQAFAAAKTVADIEALLPAETDAQPATDPAAAVETGFALPTWNRTWIAALTRRLGLHFGLLPLTRTVAWITVEGLDRLSESRDPVLYAANHQSHLDGPVILAALPAARRYRVATAASKEFFAAHFHPAGHPWRARLTSRLNYFLAAWMFNAFPLPQREAGVRTTLRYMDHLLGDGCSVLLFPEGLRSETGEMAPFQPGVALIAARLGVPVVPVCIEGLHRILPPGWRMARPGRVRVSFGSPLTLAGHDYSGLARQVEDAVRALAHPDRAAVGRGRPQSPASDP